jgi:hypothetical protein
MVEQRKERDVIIVVEVIITGLLYFGELLANSTSVAVRGEMLSGQEIHAVYALSFK